jgi:hypothetical protein
MPFSSRVVKLDKGSPKAQISHSYKCIRIRAEMIHRRFFLAIFKGFNKVRGD